MKTNLKTCPDSPWKRAFEKELRERLQGCEDGFDFCVNNDQQKTMKSVFKHQSELLKELLGE